MTTDKPGTSTTARTESLDIKRVLPAYRQIADQLLELIVDGSLKPGDRLPTEVKLSASLGVSRGTVREAIKLLASRDVVHTTRGVAGGTFVSQIDTAKVSAYLKTSLGLMSGSLSVGLSELMEARESLEVPAAYYAAERRTDSDLDLLRTTLQRETAERGTGVSSRDARNFHGVVIDTARNPLLGLMADPLFEVVNAQFLSPDLLTKTTPIVVHDHETILASIQEGDAKGAARAMRAHLVRIRAIYRDDRMRRVLSD